MFPANIFRHTLSAHINNLIGFGIPGCREWALECLPGELSPSITPFLLASGHSRSASSPATTDTYSLFSALVVWPQSSLHPQGLAWYSTLHFTAGARWCCFEKVMKLEINDDLGFGVVQCRLSQAESPPLPSHPCLYCLFIVFAISSMPAFIHLQCIYNYKPSAILAASVSESKDMTFP